MVHTASFWNITIQWTSHHDFTEKNLCLSILKSIEKFVKSECEESYSDDLTEFFLRLILLKKSASNQSGGQTHGWILLKKRFYYNNFELICCRLSPFHREQPGLATILTSFDLPFGENFKSLYFSYRKPFTVERT